jgi:Uma2 family endonuclease
MDDAIARAPKRMTVKEYLAWAAEQPGKLRCELFQGEVVAMAPERTRHNLVKSLVFTELYGAVKSAGLPCLVLGDGATVVIDKSTAYEPDALVRCGATVDFDAVTTDEPLVLVEVVSPSSKGRDAGSKLVDYFSLPSVRHYLVVDPDRKAVIHHRRGDDGAIATAILREGTLTLDPPGLAVAVEGFFAGLP